MLEPLAVDGCCQAAVLRALGLRAFAEVLAAFLAGSLYALGLNAFTDSSERLRRGGRS